MLEEFSSLAKKEVNTQKTSCSDLYSAISVLLRVLETE